MGDGVLADPGRFNAMLLDAAAYGILIALFVGLAYGLDKARREDHILWYIARLYFVIIATIAALVWAINRLWG